VTVPWPQIKIPDAANTLIPKVGKLLLTFGTLSNRIEVALFVGVGVGVDVGVGLVQPAIENEVIIRRTTIAVTFLIVYLASSGSWKNKLTTYEDGDIR